MTDTSPKPSEQLNTPSWPFFGGNARPQGPLARTCWAAVLALTLSGASVQANPAGSTQPAAQAAPAERQAKPPSKAKAKPKTKPKSKPILILVHGYAGANAYWAFCIDRLSEVCLCFILFYFVFVF